MHKIFKIIKREFLAKVITKGFVIGTVLGPILIIGITLGPAYFMSLSGNEPMTFQVVDRTGFLFEKFSEIFSDTLKDGQPRFIFSSISPQRYDSEKNAVHSDLEEGIVNAVLILPADIFEETSATFLSKSVSDIDLLQNFGSGISRMVNNVRINRAGLDPDLIASITRDVEIQTVKIIKGEEKKRGFDQEFFSSFVFLMILYMTIILYGSSIMRGVIEEKSSRVIEILLSSTNSFQLMMGKLFGVGSVGLVQYLIWTGMAMGAYFYATQSMPTVASYIYISPTILFYFIVFFVIGFFTFSTLYAAVGAMCSDMQDAQSLSAPVTILIILPFIISFMVIRDPTTDVARMLSFIPFATPLIMFLRISLVTPPFWEILVSIVINIITILLFVWIAARIYRVGLLMYGKRPTVPEILRWIRYS